MIKNMPVNPNLSYEKLRGMVYRVDSIEKAKVARMWLYENEIITNDQFNKLMIDLSFLMRELFRFEEGARQ